MLLEYRHSESPSLAVTVGGRENSKQVDTKQLAEFWPQNLEVFRGMWTTVRRGQPKVKELGVRPPPFQSTYVAPNGVDAERMEVTVWHSSGTTGASLVAALEGGMQKRVAGRPYRLAEPP